MASALLAVSACERAREAGAPRSEPVDAVTVTQPLGSTSGNPPQLVVEVLAVERVTADTVEVRLALENRAADGEPIDMATRFSEHPDEAGTLSGAFLEDDAGTRRCFVLRDRQAHPQGTSDLGTLAPGERREAWVRFGAPPWSTGSVRLVLPAMPPVESLPLRADGPAELASPTGRMG